MACPKCGWPEFYQSHELNSRGLTKSNMGRNAHKEGSQMALRPEVRIEPLEIYKQQYAHFGRMNDLLYKLPVLYSSLIGALWYFSFTQLLSSPVVAACILLFSTALCWSFIVTTNRFRLAFNQYIDSINAFDGPHAITLPRDRISTIRSMLFVLWLAFALSLLGAFYVAVPVLRLLCRGLGA